ncbi:acyltransferase family protein [Pseudorhodoferax sp.]|uniref:acyltransferase family protein n=1 Tax=Pseudorhodoferax sp. TaxID=1993553 RepID=UPI0039E46407
MTRNVSVFLDLLRVLAALFVVVSHATWPKLSGGVLPYLPGHAAVIVFFVLSGYVVAYAATQRENGPRDYVLNRLSRLWSVALPALLLTACLDKIGSTLKPELYSAQSLGDPWVALASAALFLGQIWFLDITPLSNEPFWSLPYEFWFYALFGAILHLRGRQRVWAAVGVALVAGPKILVYLPIWWFGVWLYGKGRCPLPTARARLLFGACLASLPVLYLLGYRTRVDLPWLPTGFSIADFPIALCVGGLIWSFEACRLPLARIERWVRPAAACTFTLYLCHLPILLVLTAAAPDTLPVAQRVLLVLVLTLAACAVLARFTEQRKLAFRRGIEHVLGRFKRMAMPQSS